MKKLLILLSFSLAAIAGKSQGTNGLIAHWDFNGTPNDVTGNGHNATFSDITFGNGYSGTNTAVYFKGYDSATLDYPYISVPYSSDINTPYMSVCMLVKPTAFYNGLCQGNRLFSRGNESVNGNYYLELCDNSYDYSCYTYSPDNFVFQLGLTNNPSPNNSDNYYTPTTVLNNWYCVTMTYDGSYSRVYVDGALKDSIPRVYTLNNITDGIVMGRNFYDNTHGTYPYPFTGYIDDIRLYGRALSSQEAATYCDSAKMSNGGESGNTAVVNIAPLPQILIYPNPATDKVNIQLPESNNQAEYELQNAMGQLLASGSVSRTQNSISLSNYPAGIYLLKLEINGSIVVRKILKQ
ncbi:LamG-like jellyroll fold domain-containing protein [Chitinophagaceae bacterium MMS25-I14]